MSLFAELKRRNVVRVGAAYVLIGWVIAQIAEFAFENFGAPDWVLKSVVVILLLGLPLALFFAWAFEMTPEGIKREKDVDRSQSITSQTGRKLDRAIIGILVIALGWFAWDKFLVSDEEISSEPTVQSVTGDESRGNALGALSAKSVAVLPFVAMSSGPDDEYFADGLTEEILNSLAQLPELLVTARTSAFSFKGQDIPVQKIATALGVRHIVEGSVRRSGERLRVTAQLIRANDGFHLWSETYDSTSADTITVQENIAEKIAVAMDVVLDERKRETMRQAGLRDVEAFTLYQKGLDVYNRAHGDMDQITGLRQANVYFEQVIALVPDFAQVYADHSDLFIHMLNNAAVGRTDVGVTEEDLANAYRVAITDYEAATRYARTEKMRQKAGLDLAFLSGNWRGLSGRVARTLDEPGCTGANWMATVAVVIGGHEEPYRKRTKDVLACDPLRSLSWFNAARAELWAGDKVEALRLVREGLQIAPGGWLRMAMIRILVANGLYDEASREIESSVQDNDLALALEAMVVAHQGDKPSFAQVLKQYNDNPDFDPFWKLMVYAWGGQRDAANRRAAEIDKHHFGPVALWQQAHWCACGAPWDLEATPNFAARVKEGNVPWPPPSPMIFPLKDW
jgi:TolB-like protein